MKTGGGVESPGRVIGQSKITASYWSQMVLVPSTIKKSVMAKGFEKLSQKERRRLEKEKAEAAAQEVQDHKRGVRSGAPVFVPGKGLVAGGAVGNGAGANSPPPVPSQQAAVEAPVSVLPELADDILALDEEKRGEAVDVLLLHLAAKGTVTARDRAIADLTKFVKAVGIVSMCKYNIINKIKEALSARSDVQACESYAKLTGSLLTEVGAGVEPFAVQIIPDLLECAGHNKSASLRSAAQAALESLTSSLCPFAVPLVLPSFIGALESTSWRTKSAALGQMEVLAKRAPVQMGVSLPTLIPAVSPCFWDTRKEVKASSVSLLTVAASAISNEDIQPLAPRLVSAMARPDQETASCLEELMATTFIAQVDGPTLALLVPLLSRGLREGGAAQTRKTARVIKNMCELVLDPRDVMPFVDLLKPGLERALEHLVIEEVTQVTTEALNALNKAMGMMALADGK